MELFGVPGSHVATRAPALRRFRVVDDVADHETLATRIAQRAVKDDVDLEDRLRIQAALAVSSTVGEQLRVQGVDVGTAESPKAEPTDVRDDVKLDVAAVAVPRARTEAHTLARQPRLEQVPRHRQPGRRLPRPGRLREHYR